MKNHDKQVVYDFSVGIRGKYTERYRVGLVRIDDDLRDVFPDEASINAALRALASDLRETKKG